MKVELPRRVVAGGALAFAVLTVIVWAHPTAFGDGTIDHRLLAVPGTERWHVADAVSFVASGPTVAILAVVAAAWTLFRLRRPAGAVAIVLAPALAGVAEVAMKTLVGRARPVTAALSGESGNGYPSGHVTGFAALVVAVFVVWVVQPRQRTTAEQLVIAAAAGLAVVLVAWSRIAVGAHYMTDTAGGALLGTTIGLTCPWLCAEVQTRWIGRSYPSP